MLGDLKLRYTTFIGDENAMTFACLTELKPYGEGVEILKHECVGHVPKIWGRRFGSWISPVLRVKTANL